MKRAMQRRKSFADLPDDQLSAVERGHRMRRAAAEQCRLLLDAAKSDLRRQKEEKDKQALSVSSIGVFSAYRSVGHDRAAWKATFAKHFAATKQARAKLKGGEYGDEAVETMVRIMRKFKAPPGFSRHTAGLAVDFTTTESRIVLVANSSQAARWKKSWLHKWLIKNAKKI